METNWQEILIEALRQGVDQTGSAVAGAKLRVLVSRVAKGRGVDFPPPGMRTFSSFLESFSNDIIIQRRPGQDILVAPATQPEVLTTQIAQSDASASRLRDDLFEALTRIPSEVKGFAYYVPVNDSVEWISHGQTIDKSLIELPKASAEAELGVRTRFTETIEDPHKRELLDALSSTVPLRNFTVALHHNELVMQWHQFRLSDLIARLKAWASEKGIVWQSSWVESSDSKPMAFRRNTGMNNFGQNKDLLDLVSMLTEKDIARINIPLDVVLRLLSRS